MKLDQKQKERVDALFMSLKTSEWGERFWLPRLEQMDSNRQNDVLALFEMFPSKIEWFGRMQVRKEKALTERDQKTWATIVTEEEELIKTLSKKF